MKLNRKMYLRTFPAGSGEYFLLCMLLSMTIAYAGNDTTRWIDSPHITVSFPVLYGILGLTVLFLLGVFLRQRHLYVDEIFFLLLARLGLEAVATVLSPMDANLDVNLCISLLGLSAYLIGRNSCKNPQTLYRVMRLLFFLLCGQILLESCIGRYSFFSGTYQYKQDLALPLGSSNYLAALLIAMFLFLSCCETKNSKRALYTFMVLFCVALTKSRMGTATLLLLLIVFTASRQKTLERKAAVMVFVLLLLGVGYYILLIAPLGSYLFTSSFSTVVERLSRWMSGLRLFLASPLMGYGYGAAELVGDVHNWLIQSLLRGGLLGTGLLLGALLLYFGKIYRHLDIPEVKGCGFLVLALLLSGLGEVVLFTYTGELMLWLFVGISLGQIQEVKSIDGYLGSEL